MHTVRFHPLVADWFKARFGEPTPAQVQGWKHISTGRDTLIAAPTGSGKTLAAFLWAVNLLIERAATGTLEDRTSVVYVSPLKALANDIQKNLRQPLAELQDLAFQRGILMPEIRAAVRTGDTPTSERQAMLKHAPHILITTPESFFILLTADKSRRMLARAETIIVDEIHAVAADKRGAHLSLSLERLDALATTRLQRIGLSATQKPIEEIARLLVGTDRLILGGLPDCAIVDTGHQRKLDLRIEIADHELGPIAPLELWGDIYERIVELSREHRTTIVFVGTRRLVERVSHQLSERLGADKVAAHHGSMSRQTRLHAEEGLKSGAIPVVVATASLELGIDVGHVDLVCHIGAPRAIATFLQRVGRSGHWLGGIPKGILFPLTRDDLMQAGALIRAIRAGELDRITLPEHPLDIVAQQIVAIAACETIDEADLWQLVQRAYPFRNLTRKDFEDVLVMLSDGVSTRRGRRSAHLHRDAVNHTVKGRRGARLAAITSGGAIPDTADFDVVAEPDGIFVGKVNEDFAIESMAGDIFLLGNHSWRIRRVESGKVRVIDAEGAPPTIPFWLGESPGRTIELSAAVAELRQAVAERRNNLAEAVQWLKDECSMDDSAAAQIVAYVADTFAMLGAVPTQDTVIAERFFDEGGGMQLVIHAPFGARINRAWGLALRKRFCRSFDFELQAAATDDGMVLSLGEQHSFPLESVFAMVRLASVEEDLVQAALQAPMFGTRWRWNATRALALLRFGGGKKVPLQLQRMRSEDLLAAVFPMQLACGDNHAGGNIEPPDHPLVNETVINCLQEAMDLRGLRGILERLDSGQIRTVSVDTPAPSPMSHEILNANPYAFLDDAPLEERRARAVSLRRVDPDIASGIGSLDDAALATVREQAWPDVRDADELHDVLLSLGLLPLAELPPAWETFRQQLLTARRAATAQWNERHALVASERVEALKLAVPSVTFDPQPPALVAVEMDDETAFRTIVQGWMDVVGPTTVPALAERLGLPATKIEAALARLEGDGIVLRGQFTNKTPNALRPPPDPQGLTGDPHPAPRTPRDAAAKPSEEWCERRLLARVHRLTLQRLRKEIEAVQPADFLRFLMQWQHVHPGTQLHGRDGLLQVVTQLQGLELPAPAWERDVLRARVHQYKEFDLDQLCLSGEVAWARLRLNLPEELEEGAEPTRRRVIPTRSAPIGLSRRENLGLLLEPLAADTNLDGDLSGAAQRIYEHLQKHGASFLSDLARTLRLVGAQAEDAMWELVTRGLVTGDGFAGLRALLSPEAKPPPASFPLRPLRAAPTRRALPNGRWALLRSQPATETDESEAVEFFARQMLRRWGVVLRELLAREGRAPAWRLLLTVLRRLEARGEIRGGRFVAGFVGEQFALPEAVEALRAARRQQPDTQPLLVHASDPLNLVGILTPGPRVATNSGQVIAFENGVPIDHGDLGAVLTRLRNRNLARA